MSPYPILRHGLLAHLVGLLEVDHRGEESENLVGQVRVAIDVFLQARALAPAKPLGELVGQTIELVKIPRSCAAA